MPEGHNPIWDVGEDGGTMVHRQGGNIPQSGEEMDPLTRL